MTKHGEAFDLDRALEMVKLCGLVTHDPDTIQKRAAEYGLQLVGWFDSSLTGTQGTLLEGPDKRVLVFRGTQLDPSKPAEMCKDVRTDLKFRKVRWRYARVHRGFLAAYLSVKEELVAALKTTDQEKPLFIAGHSLGGALAKLAGMDVSRKDIGAIYTFGAPKVGNSKIDALIGAPLYQFIYAADVVPRVPLMLLGFRHAGDKRFISRGGAIYRGGSLRMALTFLLTATTRPSRLIRDHSLPHYESPIDRART